LFLLYSYLPIDYKRMASDFIKSMKKVSLSIYDNSDDTDVPFNVMLDQSKRTVAEYNKNKANPPGYLYCDAGVIALDRQAVELIEGENPVSFEESVYPRLIADDELGCYIAERRFYDIGTMERLKDFEQYILEKVAR